jgi:hypothetical protein
MLKKAAILLPGLFRKTIHIDNIYENIILPNPDYEFDIFICVWDIIIKYDSFAVVEDLLLKYEELNENRLIKTFKPKQLKCFNLVNFQKYLRDDTDLIKNIQNKNTNPQYKKYPHNFYTICCQMYMCEQCIHLLENYENINSIHYDLIIRHRFDVYMKSPVFFNNYNVNNIHGIQTQHFNPNFNPDWFFFGNGNDMKNFLKIFTKLEKNEIEFTIPENMFFQSSNNKVIYDIPDVFYIYKKEEQSSI